MNIIFLNRMAIATLVVGLCCILAPRPLWSQATQPKESASQSFDQYVVQANALFKEGKLGEALSAAQAAAKLDPQRYEAPAAAALILHAAKKPAEARSAIAAALKLAPADKKEKVEAIAKMIGEAGESKEVTSATASNALPAKLTDAARRQFDTLMLIIEEADKAKLDTERKRLLQEFLDKSTLFLKENPDQLPIWTLRAVAALELDDGKIGWETGQQLIKFGMDKSDEPRVRKIFAMLDRKGWLNKDFLQNEERKAEAIRAKVEAEKARQQSESDLREKFNGKWVSSSVTFISGPRTERRFWEITPAGEVRVGNKITYKSKVEFQVQVVFKVVSVDLSSRTLIILVINDEGAEVRNKLTLRNDDSLVYDGLYRPELLYERVK